MQMMLLAVLNIYRIRTHSIKLFVLKFTFWIEKYSFSGMTNYIKSGSLIQDSTQNCDCLSSNMDESKGSISNSEVMVALMALK
jgi:hypothetical protein